jgi:6-phosphofructokinase 2
MGGDAVAVYPAGGLTGKWLNERLQRDGVRTRPIHVAGETREDFTVSEEATSSQYRFVLAGAPIAERELEECLRIYSQAVSQSRFVVASGSLPPDAPFNLFARAARIAKDRGAKMIVDTSGPALAAALKEGVYLIKPNLHEFQDLLGHRAADDGMRCCCSWFVLAYQ